jgi:cytochrome c-type biogenesis protein CcmH
VILRWIAVAAAALVIVAPAWAQEPPNAADLEAELVCPVCETTLDQSDAPAAQRMKLFIRERIAAGDSEEEIKDALVADYGEGVLASPPRDWFGVLAWLVPLGVVLGAGVVIALLVRSWSRRRADAAAVGPPLDPELDSRVDDELARFEG